MTVVAISAVTQILTSASASAAVMSAGMGILRAPSLIAATGMAGFFALAAPYGLSQGSYLVVEILPHGVQIGDCDHGIRIRTIVIACSLLS